MTRNRQRIRPKTRPAAGPTTRTRAIPSISITTRPDTRPTSN